MAINKKLSLIEYYSDQIKVCFILFLFLFQLPVFFQIYFSQMMILLKETSVAGSCNWLPEYSINDNFLLMAIDYFIFLFLAMIWIYFKKKFLIYAVSNFPYILRFIVNYDFFLIISFIILSICLKQKKNNLLKLMVIEIQIVFKRIS
jgi:hypothetical protein